MRDTSRPVSFATGARTAFELAFDTMLWSRKSLLMVLLLALPVAFALLYRAVLAAEIPAHVTPFDLYGRLVALYYLGNVLPLAALFYATSMVSEEVEGKTITYLLTRPVPRASILAGKFAAYLAATLTLCLPATVITFFGLISAQGADALAAAVPDLLRDLATMALALLAYGGLFALAGVYLRRPVVPGLLFIYGWETVARLPGGLGRFTLTAHLRSLISHRPADEGLSEMFGQVFPPATSLQALLVVVAVTLFLAVRAFSRREYVLQQ